MLARLTTLVLSAVLAMLLGLSHAEARPSWSGFYTVPPQLLRAPPGTLLKYETARLPVFFRAKAWRILYVTRDYLGRPIASSGLVVLPDYAPANAAARGIVAWAHPTTGIARHCAPTLAKSPVTTILGINELVASGHIVAATDYPGLGTTGPIGYLVGRGQAYAVIDSVRAARQIPGVGGRAQYALWGYSQGGQAVLFASSLARSYAPELQLVGTAAIAPPTDLAQLFRDDLKSVAGRVLTSFALGSWAAKYSIPISTIAGPAAARTIFDINTNCINDLQGMLDVNAAQKPLAGDFLLADPTSAPPWNGIIAGNSISTLPRGTAALVMQGKADAIVSPGVTRRFVKRACADGAAVQYVELPQKGHGGSARAGARQAVAWLNARLSGTRLEGACR